MQVNIPTKSIDRSWTFWFNVATILLVFIGAIIDAQVNLGIPPTLLAWLVVINGVGNVLLRVFKTSLPIGPEGGSKTVEAPLPKEVG